MRTHSKTSLNWLKKKFFTYQISIFTFTATYKNLRFFFFVVFRFHRLQKKIFVWEKYDKNLKNLQNSQQNNFIRFRISCFKSTFYHRINDFLQNLPTLTIVGCWNYVCVDLFCFVCFIFFYIFIFCHLRVNEQMHFFINFLLLRK